VSLVEIDIRTNDETAAGFASVMARIAALKALAGDIKFGVGVDANGLNQVVDNIDRIETHSRYAALALEDIAMAMHDASSSGSAAAGGGLGAATVALMGMGGWAGRAAMGIAGLRQTVSLFGGVFDKALPAWLAGASYLHLLVDGFVELAAVVIPAAIALTAFGIAAVPTVQDIVQHMQNLNTVVQATGQNMYPLTGAFNKMADAAKPYVYQLFGDALNIAGQKSGFMQQIVSSTGAAVAQLGARFTVAMTNGQGLGAIMGNASVDVAKLGDVFGNLGGILGSVFKSVPGYANVLLTLADGVSKVAENVVRTGQPILAWGLAAHGAFLYAGLAATGFANIMPKILSGVGNLVGNLGAVDGKLASFGAAGEKAASGLRGFGVAAAGASALPWGWIALAAAGILAIALAARSAHDATVNWLNSMQQTLQAMHAVQAFNVLSNDQIQIESRLAAAHDAVASAVRNVGNDTFVSAGKFGQYNQTLMSSRGQVNELTKGQQLLSDQSSLYGYRLNMLAHQYGGLGAAQGLLIASGVTWAQMMDKSSTGLAQLRAMVYATALSYAAMGQRGGQLGADLAALDKTSSSAWQNMTKLNQAFQALSQTSLGLMSNFNGVLMGMRQLATQAKGVHNAFTGTSNAALTVQNNFLNLLGSTNQVMNGMRMAGASSHSMAQVLATELKPAADAGALANAGLRGNIFSMAEQAGYAGPNKIGPLSHWLDQNATSAARAAAQVRNEASAIAALHSKTITLTTVQQMIYRSQGSTFAGPGSLGHNVGGGHAQGGIMGAASGGARGGMTWVGEQGPELVNLPYGSTVYSNADSQARANALGGGSMVVTLMVQGGNDDFSRMMVSLIKRYVQHAGGGDVQQALGWNG
jgi:hypothetical protein